MSRNNPFAVVDVEKLERCTHCGFCLPTCPTYAELGLEMDSPRGRIYLIKALRDGRLEPTEQVTLHLYRCLECRACESACPSGVAFGPLMEEARDALESGTRRARWQRLLADLVFQRILPYPSVVNRLVGLMSWYQRLGGSLLVQRTPAGRLLGRRLRSMEALLPAIPSRKLRRPLPRVTPALGERRYRVGFLSGCLMHPLFAPINRATVRVLAQNGCEVITPPEQLCCGALHVHNGRREEGRQLARHNLQVFLQEEVDAIVTNSAGCGATLKEYHHLLDEERAETFAKKVRDVSEWLVEIGFQPPERPIPLRVAYDDPCHLLHGQRIASQPRKLLTSIPELQLIPLPESDWCCGSAGIYNIVQPEMAERVLQRKMEHVRKVQPDVLATANPGCLLQLQVGVRRAGLRCPVVHVVELLDWAYTGQKPASLS
ncbi:MAG: glycolate oxidase iron-sulfur subunit [Candidatus Poribacteria bacterium]|nr:MAG: glycolate oxidase iron-sulfur subunit [Candidatus Poribacteria bacterium]